MVLAVLFDGDQTLWDFELVMHDALTVTLGELRQARPGQVTDSLTVADLQADRNAVALELEGVEYNLARLRRLGFARTLLRLRDDHQPPPEEDAALVDRLAVTYFHQRDLDPALFPDTIPCLQSLHGHYRLGLLSNGSRLPEVVGLAGYFEVAVFAQDHRVAKPDRGIFEIAQRQLGVEPADCVLIGDHRLNDVVGAKRSGWKAVWIDRRGEGSYRCPRGWSEAPDAVITSLDQLAGVLAGW
jgi:FMN hydrolase / 5-amino-6-(5-phospho-D-ribitylamino)uracil phosphatase